MVTGPLAAARLETMDLDHATVLAVQERLADVRETMAAAPKSLKWRARARIGRRVPWYDLPEEVD